MNGAKGKQGFFGKSAPSHAELQEKNGIHPIDMESIQKMIEIETMILDRELTNEAFELLLSLYSVF